MLYTRRMKNILYDRTTALYNQVLAQKIAIARKGRAIADDLRNYRVHLSHYRLSSRFEQDLDRAIAFLHLHAPETKPDFTYLKEQIDRITCKSKYVRRQAIACVSGFALIGAELGANLGIAGAKWGFVVGSAAGILLITVVAGVIVYRRLTAKEYKQLQLAVSI